MCVTLHPAKLSNTKIYAGSACLDDGRLVHVLAYQNRAASEGPNAMILPLPAKGEIGPENTVDTRPFRHFLDDIHAYTKFTARFLGGTSSKAVVFDVGSYTVVLAERQSAISASLSLVPVNKRPKLNGEVLLAFERLYPGWPLAVCCWDGSVEAEPLLWWYEPKMPDRLFAPALDAHDGRAPDVKSRVSVDHLVAFGYGPQPLAVYPDRPVRYRDTLPAGLIQRLLPIMVVGTQIQGMQPNGDFWLPENLLPWRGGGVAGRSFSSTANTQAVRFPPGGEAEQVPVRLSGWA